MKSSEGNLRYPNMLNEQYDTFRNSVESADAPATEQQYAVFESLRHRLDEQLEKWQLVVTHAVPALNELMRREGMPALNASEGKASPDSSAKYP